MIHAGHQSSSHPKRGTLTAWQAAAASGLHDCRTARKVCPSGDTFGRHPSNQDVPQIDATNKPVAKALRTRALTTVAAKPSLLDTVGNPPVRVMVPESKQMTQQAATTQHSTLRPSLPPWASSTAEDFVKNLQLQKRHVPESFNKELDMLFGSEAHTD